MTNDAAVRPRILYVEDDDDVRTMVRDLLQVEGFDVVAQRTAEEAVATLRGERFSLFLTDYHLPRQNADWIFRRAADEDLLGDTPVIVLSGALNPRGIQGHRFLRKPIAIDELLEIIRHVIHVPTAMPAESISGVVLKLYCREPSGESMRAIRNIRRALDQFPAGEVRLDVHNIDDPASADSSLDDDRIVATPTLVRRQPLPKVWIVGDLSNGGAVEEVIRMGLERLKAPGRGGEPVLRVNRGDT